MTPCHSSLSRIPTMLSMLVSKCWIIDDITNSIALLINYPVMRSVVGRKQSKNGSPLPRMQIFRTESGQPVGRKGLMSYYLSTSAFSKFWLRWMMHWKRKQGVNHSFLTKIFCCSACTDECVLISYCARSVRNAEKRHWFIISMDIYKFSFTILYPYNNRHSIFGILNEIGFSHSFPYFRFRTRVGIYLSSMRVR